MPTRFVSGCLTTGLTNSYVIHTESMYLQPYSAKCVPKIVLKLKKALEDDQVLEKQRDKFKKLFVLQMWDLFLGAYVRMHLKVPKQKKWT